MGKYINLNSKGEHIGTSYQDKVNSLIADGATTLDPSNLTYQPNMVCVMNNGMFAAAGYAYSESEFKAFNMPDGRSKTWLVYPHAEQVAN